MRKIYEKDSEGVDILEDKEDWDNLIVLDSCRYDRFSELNSIEGNLEKIKTQWCVTDIWLRKTFTSSYEEIVYISPTSRVSKENPSFNPIFNSAFDSSRFYDVIEAYDNKNKPKDGNWLSPEKVTEAAISAKETYPNKKLIIHYFQPHAPYKSIKDITSGAAYKYKKEGYSSKEIRDAYDNNLELVLEEIEEKLIPELNGSTIITGDHGEFLGEFNLYGHYIGVARDELLEVPWLEIVDKTTK